MRQCWKQDAPSNADGLAPSRPAVDKGACTEVVGAGPCSRTRRLPPCRYSKAKASQGPGGDKQQQGLGLALLCALACPASEVRREC